MKKLSHDEQIELKEMSSYLHVSELELLLKQLHLSSDGFNKNELITRLIHFLEHHQPLHDTHLDFTNPWPIRKRSTKPA